MDTIERFTSLLFFFSFLFTTALAMEFCSDTFCSRPEPTIRFPFRLQNRQPEPCGYPGFDLFCDTFHQTLINIPNSGNFRVSNIDYETQNIWLNDPDNCLGRRLLYTNFSGSPFRGVFFQNFTFFNCTFDNTRYMFNPIECLSGDNYTVFASSSAEAAFRFMTLGCKPIATVAVPVQWDFFETMTTSDLNEHIRLRWAEPNCGRCESRGGRCGLRSNTSSDIVCSDVPRRHRVPKSARYAIIAAAATPAFLFLVGFCCVICRRMKNYRRRRHPIMEFSMAVTPQLSTTVSGLDGTTIESYPKTTLGDSLRLPMPDHNVCSICLSEYMPKETLRNIPECQHWFHAECIDEWLKMNASCPVCRNSPKS